MWPANYVAGNRLSSGGPGHFSAKMAAFDNFVHGRDATLNLGVERRESVSVVSGIVSITGAQPVARENALIVQILTAEGIVSPLAAA